MGSAMAALVLARAAVKPTLKMMVPIQYGRYKAGPWVSWGGWAMGDRPTLV
jgi:hypothetical protein